MCAAPDGRTLVQNEGGAELATAGTGDCLAGLAGGGQVPGQRVIGVGMLGLGLPEAASVVGDHPVAGGGECADLVLPGLAVRGQLWTRTSGRPVPPVSS